MVLACVVQPPPPSPFFLRYVTLHFRDRRSEVLIRYRSGIAPKSSFLCANSSLRKPAAKSQEKRMFSQAI